MAEQSPKNNAHCTIPDDPEQSTYRFIIVAAKRARQLQAAAQQFITPLTFTALTGRKVITGLFSASTSNSEATLASAVEHIGVAQDNELLVVAPATADLLAKFAHGMADDFLTTMYLAFTG